MKTDTKEIAGVAFTVVSFVAMIIVTGVAIFRASQLA